MDQIVSYAFGFAILFVLFALFLGLIVMFRGGWGRQTEEGMSPEEKRKYVAQWVGSKYGRCADCNNEVDSAKMTILQKYSKFSGDDVSAY